MYRLSKISGVLCLLGLLFSACESKLDDNPSGLPLLGTAPRIVQLTARDTALVAQWTKVASAQGIAPTYEVWYGTSSDSKKAAKFGDVTPNQSNLVLSTISGLANHQTYYVWVRSVFGELGISDFSPTSAGIPIPPPKTPDLITVASGEAMLDLTWEPVLDAFTYNVFYTTGSGGNEPPEGTPMAPAVSDAGAIISNLADNVSYTVWVQAENTAGKSGYSKSTGTPKKQETGPTNTPVIKTVTPGNGKLTLTWDQVPGVPRYSIFSNTADSSAGASEFNRVIPADSPTVTAELTGLTNGQVYYVWVKSKNSEGDSDFSASKSGKPEAKKAIDWNNAQFELGYAAAEYVFAQDVPASRFFPEGRPYTDRLTRIQESTLGDMFTDAAAWYVRNVLRESIDFVFLNGSFIDNVLPQGTIRLGGLAGVVGSDARADKLVLLSLTGAKLKEFFGVTSGDTPVPNSVAAVTHMGRGGANTGYFGMVSKEITYTIEYPKSPAGTTPELSGDDADKYWHGRIKAGTLKLNGVEIDDAKTYRFCTTDYNASGIYFLILSTDATDKKLISTRFYHAVAEYIYDKGTVTPKLDGRIQLEGGVPLPPPWKNSTWNPYNN